MENRVKCFAKVENCHIGAETPVYWSGPVINSKYELGLTWVARTKALLSKGKDVVRQKSADAGVDNVSKDFTADGGEYIAL